MAKYRATVPLLAVAAGFAVLQLCYAVVHMDLGWDETVYLSQVDPRHPAAYFSAPRSRGITLLVSPLIAVTSSVLTLRIALALLSAAALYAAFKVWEPLLGKGRVALAALLFATLWITVLSGPEVMPNLWLAFTAVAATGWFLRARTGAPERRKALFRLTATLAAATLLRAPDGVWLSFPLLAACALARPWRRPAAAGAVLGGLALGGLQWAIEAYVRFGGILKRLSDSSDTEGGMGRALGAGVRAAFRSLDGPQLCRPCHIAAPPVTHTLWWLLLPVLALAACALAARRPDRAAIVLPVAGALSLAVPYLLLLDYAAPRFLLPCYALLALPVADLTVRAVRAMPAPRRRSLVALLLCAVFAGHLAVQVKELRYNAADARDTAVRYRRAARELNRLGVAAPCLVTGPRAQPIGYEAGCTSAQTMGNNRSTTTAGLLRAAAAEPLAVLFDPADGYLPPYARHWHRHPLPGTDWSVYLR
ncbi:hypothetical protein [Streptomyces orinoci]|uniref:Integral membrane protein n=1 Tax=Streptomyces orinoci TaxID=67339 RepID=A0ABV3K495_STRON|nr:hypothetical protein [Streptomyces orinoci]